MMVSTKRVIFALATIAAGFCSCVFPPTHKTENGLFLTIEWYGSLTKPLFNAGLATEIRKSELEKWGSKDDYNLTAVISDEELTKLEEVLQRTYFLQKRTSESPSAEVQQYVIIIHGPSRQRYIPLGLDRDTVKRLTELQSSLGPVACVPVSRLMQALPAMFRD
jgi:hypothetical protein